MHSAPDEAPMCESASSTRKEDLTGWMGLFSLRSHLNVRALRAYVRFQESVWAGGKGAAEINDFKKNHDHDHDHDRDDYYY